jgi:hypothetical protein
MDLKTKALGLFKTWHNQWRVRPRHEGFILPESYVGRFIKENVERGNDFEPCQASLNNAVETRPLYHGCFKVHFEIWNKDAKDNEKCSRTPHPA